MLGELIVILSLIFGLASLTMYLFTYRNYENTIKLARNSYNLQFLFIVAAIIFLLKSILSHNYFLSYVYEFSSNDLSNGLLLSTFYAGQEGSFLLWLFFGSLLGLILKRQLKKIPRYEASVMIFYLIGLIFLNILILPGLKNPFASMFSEVKYISTNLINKFYLGLPELQRFIFTNTAQTGRFLKLGPELKSVLDNMNIPISNFIINGQGLNPLLQNFWMEIHPPILFLGFAFTAVPFSYAMSAFLRNEYRSWLNKALPWLLVGMGFLGAGIMIGGYWAYGVLGWGGYWGWDPVENSSLVPWIVGVALIHTLIVQKKYQKSHDAPKFIRLNLALAILTYVLVIYSTFLTRSGVLSDASVHSFVEPGMFTYSVLVAFILSFILMGIYSFMIRWKDLKSESYKVDGLFNRESILFYGTCLMAGIALIILAGTSAPIWGTSVETSFYNTLNKPMAILGTFLLGACLFLSWGRSSNKQFVRNGALSFLTSFAFTLLIIYITKLNGILNYLFILGSTFALITNLYFFQKNIRHGFSVTGGQIAHIGISIFLIGVALNGNLIEKFKVDLPKGKPVNAGIYSLQYVGYSPIPNSFKYAFDVRISDGKNSYLARPVMYNSSYNNSLMREPDVIEGVLKDIYLSPLALQAGGNLQEKEILLKKGGTKNVNGMIVRFEKFVFHSNELKKMSGGKDFKIFARFSVKNKGKIYFVEPYVKYEKEKNISVPDTIKPLGLVLNLKKINPSGSVQVIIKKTGGEHLKKPEILSAELSIEPYIILIWLGVVLVTLGFFISATKRKLNY